MQSKAGMLARASVLAALLASTLPTLAWAQYESVPQPAAYAIRNATVVQANGRRQEGVTVVVRGSLIEAIGRDVEVPADAELLEGDSLMVYPGFVDGDGEADHEFPDPDIDRREVEIWNAPRSLQGFMPARRLVSFLTADGEDVADQRRAGIVAAAVHPEGAMMGGRGTVVLYRKDATGPEQLVIEPTLGPEFELTGARGVYPGTLFGVMAFFRQAFEDARHREDVAAAQAQDPRGLTMPPYDPDYAVLQEVLSGDVPVYFEADEAPDILRVIGLADEYGFKPVILGGGEAWRVADELKARSIPVLVSVDFPEPRRWKAEEDTAGAPPLDAAAQREKDSLEDRYANAGRLVEAGVTVALTSGGEGEVLEGARKAVEHGLPEPAALAALTATPAGLFGIPSVVRVETGLPATFVVTTGPLFAEDTKIAYTFVEGREEEGSTSTAAGSAEDAVAFGGEWSMTIDADGQIMDATLTVEQDGATFTGSMELMGGRAEVRDGTINGNEIAATAIMDQGGQTLDIKITGTVEGDEASGDVDAGPLGTARWTARRSGPGGAR